MVKCGLIRPLRLSSVLSRQRPNCPRTRIFVRPTKRPSAPLASVVKAEDTTVIKRDRDEDTTVIKRDRDGDKTVIEKRQELNVLPVPHTEEKTIIKKERD